jgi:hypothetical protein
MSKNWGPHFIVPTGTSQKYSGAVRLRETLDRELIAAELADLGLPQKVVKVTNPWYYRKQGTETWIKVGESDQENQNFAVTWDTTRLENGRYEVLGLMHVFVSEGGREGAIARQGLVQVAVEN